MRDARTFAHLRRRQGVTPSSQRAELSNKKMEGVGAYGGGKAGGTFDPVAFAQRPQVVLRAVCWVSGGRFEFVRLIGSFGISNAIDRRVYSRVVGAKGAVLIVRIFKFDVGREGQWRFRGWKTVENCWRFFLKDSWLILHY